MFRSSVSYSSVPSSTMFDGPPVAVVGGRVRYLRARSLAQRGRKSNGRRRYQSRRCAPSRRSDPCDHREIVRLVIDVMDRTVVVNTRFDRFAPCPAPASRSMSDLVSDRGPSSTMRRE